MSLQNLAQNFIKSLDTNKDGVVSRSEYEAYLKTQKMPANMATNLLSIFDSSKDGNISESEMLAAYTSVDTNNDSTLTYNEMLLLQNQLSGIAIDTSTSSTQYTALYKNALNFLNSADANKDGMVSVAEYQTLLGNSNYDTAGAQAFVNYYDGNSDGNINLLEFIAKSIQIDADKNGALNATELQPVSNLLRKLTNIELGVKKLVASIDGNTGAKDADGKVIKDGVVSLDEYKTYLSNNYMPQEMADLLMKTYGNGSSISYDQWVSAFKSFDADGDGTMNFTENLTYQNTISTVKFDTSMSQAQYTNLFKTAQSFMKAGDTNKDGNVNVLEERGAITAANQKVTNSSSTTPEYYAENLLMAFDMDRNPDPTAATIDPTLSKDGVVNLFEFMKGIMQFDTDSDGAINSTESQTLKESLDNPILFNDVNKMFSNSDANNDRILSANELSQYFVSQGLPGYLADNFINYVDKQGNVFDLDKDGALSRLEIMQAFKKFDSNVNNQLDIDEKMALYDELTQKTINLNLNADSVRQYTNMFETLQKYVKELDFDNNSLVSSDEYKTYLLDQNLPEYLADKAIQQIDLNKDGNLDLLEWFKINIQNDKNANGSLELNEELSLYQTLSGVQLNATPENEVQYAALYDNLKDYLLQNDINNDKILNSSELRAYFTNQNLPEYLADKFIQTYDISKDGNLDLLELMKSNVEFDTNFNGSLELNEELAFNSKVSGVQLNATPANEVQYTSLYTGLKDVLNQFDSTSDKKLDNTELKNYFSSINMPEELVNKFLTNYDFNKDGSIDLLEFMKIDIDSDTDKSGILELNEMLNFEGKLAGINLNATTENLSQYSSLYNILQGVLQSFDSTGDKQFSSFELREYFKLNNLPLSLADGLIQQYDNNTNTKVDLLEWLKAYVDYDINKNGTLEFNEQIAFESKLEGINLSPTPENETQYSNLYNTITSNLSTYDLTQDNSLNSDELKVFFRDQNLPAYLADKFIQTYDINRNGSVDILEWLKANVDFDADKNGVLEFSENLALNSSLSSVVLNSNSSNQRQYEPLYNTSTSTIQVFDTTSDQKLNSIELSNYFVANGFSASLASQMIGLYDANKDGSIDTIEFLKANIDYDVNQNGGVDFNEFLSQNAKFANMNISAAVAETNQTVGNFNTASGIIGGYDVDRDNNLSQTELRRYFGDLGVAGYVADNLMKQYDVNADGKLNNLEFMKALIDADVNKNGGQDFDETVNLYARLSGVAVNVTPVNFNQEASLWNSAVGMISGYDSDGDKKLSSTQFGQWFKDMGLPQYMASNLVTQYDVNRDATLDAVEMLKMFTDMDTNQNGGQDFDEMVKLYSRASGINFDMGIAQLTGIYNSAAGTLANYDSSWDRLLSSSEIGQWFKDMGMPQYMANNFITQNDVNKDGSLDTMEMAKIFYTIDNNQNGGQDFDELMKIYSQTSGVNINITDANRAQYTGLYNSAAGAMANFDGSGNRELSSPELINYFKTLGMPGYMSNNFLSRYDANRNGSIDTMELMQGLIASDQNGSGGLETGDIINMLQSLSGVNLTSGYAIPDMLAGIYGQASGIYGYDYNGDAQLTSGELNMYFMALGLTSAQAQAAASSVGSLDMAKWMKTLEGFDTNKDGVLDGDEWANLINSY